MTYFVTFEKFGEKYQPLSAAINPKLSLAEALEHAHIALLERRRNVAINDDAGNSISGDDLVACCKGTKKLSADLKASR